MKVGWYGITDKLDSHLLVVQQIGAFKNDTKGSFTDLLSYSVVYTHYIRRRGSHRETSRVTVDYEELEARMGLESNRTVGRLRVRTDEGSLVRQEYLGYSKRLRKTESSSLEW